MDKCDNLCEVKLFVSWRVSNVATDCETYAIACQMIKSIHKTAT